MTFILCSFMIFNMKINSLERIFINNSQQWILVRGKSDDAPLLLHVQGGPGLPIIPEADVMERLLHLEDHYTVAYWDQRGCGKSFNKKIDPRSVTFSQLSNDIISCAEYLTHKYNKRDVAIIGYSIGATISLMASVKQDKLFRKLFLVGIDVDIQTANVFAINNAKRIAAEYNDPKIVRQLEDLGKTPIIETKKFQQRAKIVANLGGIFRHRNYKQLVLSSMKNLFRCRYYSFTDIIKTVRGMEFCQNALLPELDKLDLFKLMKEVHVPLHFIQGRYDGVCPVERTREFYNYLQSPEKQFTLFEDSAHMPHYDEPEKFSEIITAHS